MEEEIFRRKQASCMASNRVSTTSPHLNSMHNDSQPILKAAKPKIRIIHIFAPEIIKTDVANFRELVQRLTGKPPPNHHRHQDITSFCNKKKKPTRSSIIASSSSRRSSREEDEPKIRAYTCDNKNMEMRTGCRSSSVGGGASTRERERERIKGEEEGEIWKSSSASACDNNSSGSGGGGFLSGFADMDGFMQELGGFPVLPNPMDASHHMHPHVVFGESQFA